MADNPAQPPEEQPASPLEHIREAADHVVEEIADRVGAHTIQGPESFFLLVNDLRDLIRGPMAALGLPLEDEAATMYDWQNNIYNFYRVPLADGYLALIHLQNQITEAYEPTPNNSVAGILNWLVLANDDLEIRGICFFTDGRSVDRPYKTMCEQWVRNTALRFADFIVEGDIRDLRRMQNPDQRRVALGRIFQRDELAPRAAGAGLPGPAGAHQPPGLTVADLDDAADRKNELVQILQARLVSGLPAISVQARASELIGETSWPEVWKNDRVAALTGNPATDARNLVEYTIEQAYIPDTEPRVSALGNLLARLRPHVGPDQRSVIDGLVAEFNL